MRPGFDNEQNMGEGSPTKLNVVVAGPSSSVTVPGIMTSEVIGVLAPRTNVTRLEVDFGKNFSSGLHRAMALSPKFQKGEGVVHSWRPLLMARQRRQEFRQYFKDHVELAVALAWPGLNNSWIEEFVQVANQAGATTVVLIVSHPTSSLEASSSIARQVADADLALVGDIIDATVLSATLGSTRPVIEVQRALSLNGRTIDYNRKRLTTFLPKDDEQSLLSVLASFDAIPDEWIHDYDLRVIMRYSGREIRDYVAASHHAEHVELIGEDFSSLDLRQIAGESSALSVADPAFDSRAYATAVDAGVVTVVLADNMVTDVGRRYVGGLLADIKRPTSVHVAHCHALRLSELHFPSPDAWFELAARLDDAVKHVSPVWSGDSSSLYV